VCFSTVVVLSNDRSDERVFEMTNRRMYLKYPTVVFADLSDDYSLYVATNGRINPVSHDDQ
jgi:hypothetical protein